MLKKFLSMLLAVMMIVSVLTVGVVTTGAATTGGFTPESTKIYFDVEGAVDASGKEWADLMGTKGKIAFYIAGGDLDTEANPTKPIAWGGKKAQGTATSGESGIFEFDPAAKLGTLTDGVQYKLIFVRVDGSNWKEQTYDLFFTTECLGHIAKCDGTMTENPVDSSKKALTAYWDDAIDPTKNGPVKGITSIGNVVGSCIEGGKTDYDLLKEFFAEEKTDFNGKTGYQNAHKYKCEIDPSADGYKSEQKLIDDIGAGLSLTKDDVKAVLEEEDVVAKLADLACSWSYDDSDLPSSVVPHTHTPGEPVQENIVPASCKAEGSYDEVVYCTECGEEISREAKTIDKLAHTPGEAVQENIVPATCKAEGSYDEVVYCTECGDEISREAKTIDKLDHTPGEAVQENEVVSHDKTTYDEVVYCTECGAEISRTPVELPIITHTLTYVAEVPATEDAEGTKAHYTCSGCDKLFADAAGAVEVTADDLVIPKLVHIHTPGEPVQDQMAGYPATCTEDGLKVMVTYCTECGEELSREEVVITADGHDIIFVAEVPATANKDGVKAHYECTKCNKLFADAEGAVEVSAEDLVIKAEHVRGDANGDGVFDMSDVTVLQRVLVEIEVENYDAVAADADLDGEVDAIDVTLMQRVLAEMTTYEQWDARHAQ